MPESFKEEFYECLLEYALIADQEWAQSPHYREEMAQRQSLQEKLLQLIPEQKRAEAQELIDDLYATYHSESDFFYLSGFQHGVRLHKLIEAL